MKNRDFVTGVRIQTRIGTSGPILMILVPMSTNLRSLSSILMRKCRIFNSFINIFVPEKGPKQPKWPNWRCKCDMKEQKKITFLIRFGLGDLEIGGFGTKIIKIGQEMPILEQFVVHVQNIMKSTKFCTFYYSKRQLLPP